MTLTMAHVILLPCLVAMVAAAPVAEQTNNQEQVVNVNGNSNAVDRAKRAEEEMLFGNQQNGARLAAAAKKSVDVPYPPFFDQQDVQPSYNYKNQVDNADKAGYMYASKQLPNPVQEETMSELQAVESEGSQDKPGDVEKQQDNTADVKAPPPVPEVEKLEQVELTDKTDMGKEQKEAQVLVEEPKEEEEEEEEAEQIPQLAEPIPKAQAVAPPVEPEVQAPITSRLPQDSRRADAEEALQAQDQLQKTESDDIENFLKALQEPKEISETQNEGDGEAGKEAEEEEQKEEEQKEEEQKEEEQEKDEEGSAEAELMQVANQEADVAEKDMDSEDYTKKLLSYILLHGDEYGRVPVSYANYPYPGSYYVQRRRRSLAHRRFPHIHRRRRSGSSKQLARSKRTKRDLFDDELYYNPEEQYQLQQAEEEAEKEAEMEELISYLMALYPALYDNQPPPQDSPYPGYLWYGSNYPEEAYPEIPELEEPEYVEVPVGWEPAASQPVPAWEPAFYPEEVVEEPSYYPAPAKRQMLNLFPEQRRKRYFYPYARDLYSRRGAFIPSQEKRDYDNAYKRLKDLAMVLADARQPSPYFDAFSDYRKK